jgi:hypothetical protein
MVLSTVQYEEDLVAWHEGRRPAKPKFRLFWIEPTSLGYWGGVSYTAGALLYNIGAAQRAACIPDDLNCSLAQREPNKPQL